MEKMINKDYADTVQDMVNHPYHYEGSTSIECIDAMLVAFGSYNVFYFCLQNAFKYLWRHKNKNGLEDVKKAQWYLDYARYILEEANEREDFRKCLPSVLAFVRGNNDPHTFPLSYDIGKYNLEARTLLKGSVIMPYSQLLNVNGQNLYITHGHLQNIEYTYEPIASIARENNCKTVIYGHTHIPEDLDGKECRLINPGSISRPRGGMPATFAILTVEKTFIDAAFLKIENHYFSAKASFSIMKGF